MQRPMPNSGQSDISHTRYPEKCFTHICSDLYKGAMMVPIWMGTNMADGNLQKNLSPSFAAKA